MPKESNNISKTQFTDMSEILKMYDKVLGREKEFQKIRDTLAKNSELQRLQELKSREQDAQKRASLEESIQFEIQRIEQASAQAVQKMWAKTYKEGTIQQKVQMQKQVAESQKSAREQAQYELNVMTQLRDQSVGEQRKQLNAELRQKRSQIKQLQKAEADSIQQLSQLEQQQHKQELKQQVEQIKTLSKSKLKSERDQAKQQLKELNNTNKKAYAAAKANQVKLNKDLKQLQKSGASEEEIAAKSAELAAANAEVDSTKEDYKATSGMSFVEDIKKSLSNAFNQFSNEVIEAQHAADSMMSNYQSRVNANLQGSGKTFQDALELVEKNLAISPIVKMEDVINSIKEASDQGIMYNIEQRSFLNTVSDKIAHTFDAFDSNLTRLIRLQQADSTAARLGLEANLTKLFNSTFNDSSYLTDVYDSVSQAIIDANSQLTKEQSAEFEYTLQKWLGSLYSMGLSSNTVTQIAQGINMLATGDVTNLSNNSSLQTLMAMSASNAGLDFAQIMLDGLDADTTNALLESMVMYLKDIAENSDSQVVKSAYGDIFNMSLSDLKSFSNMTTSDISRISGTSMSYNNMVSETQSQLLQTIQRASMTENMSNIFSNALYGMGLDMAQNPATWTLDKVLQFMESSGIDINIPFVSVFGSGLDINATVTDLMRMGLGVAGAFSLITNVLGALGTGGGTGLQLSDWGGTEVNQRGTGIGGLLSTMIGGTSSSTYVSNSSTSDIQTSAISSATDEAAETSKITNKNAETNEHTLDDFWKATVGNSASDYLKVSDVFIQNVYDISTGSLRTLDYGINQARQGNYLRVRDDSFASYFGKFTFDSSNSLRVVETSGDLTRIISKLDTLSSTMRSDKPMAVTLPTSTTVRIDQNTLVQAILTALGGSGENIKLKQFIEGSLQEGMDNKVPIMAVRNDVGQNINVRIEDVNPMVTLNTY